MTARTGPTDRAPPRRRWTLVAAAQLAAIAAVVAWWSGVRWGDLERLTHDVGASPDAGRLLGVLAGFGAVAVLGLARLRAPPWALAAPGALALAIAGIAAEIGALGPASLGPTASFGQRADALFRAAGVAGSLAGAGLLTASALLAAAAIAAAVVPAASDPAAAASRDALPRWALPAALGVLAATLVLVGSRWRDGVDARLALCACLPAALAMLAVALGERRGRNGDAVAIAAIGVGAVLAWALALAMTGAYELETESVEPAMVAAYARGAGFRRLAIAASFALAPASALAIGWWRRRPSAAPRALAPALGVALLGASALIAVALRGRAVISRIPDLASRQAALRARPGEAVEDDALPAGTLAVELVSGAASLELEEPASVIASPGGRRLRWTPDGPAMFDGLSAGSPVELRVEGPYLAGSARAAPPAGGHGARVAVLALPHQPPRPRPGLGPGWAEKTLELDLTDPAKPMLRWLEGPVQLVVRELPQPAPPAALAALVEAQWKEQGSHRDPNDRKFDQAAVIAPRGASFAEVLAAVGAVEATERDIQGQRVPHREHAFRLSVTEPSPPRRVSADEGAARLAARAESAPPAERAVRLGEALASCRALTCSPALYGSLWRSLGSTLAGDGADERAIDAFQKALAVDPDGRLDGGASEVATRAFDAARKRGAAGVLLGPHAMSGRARPEVLQEAARQADGPARLCFLLAPPPPPAAGAAPFDLSVRVIVGRDGAVYHRKPDGLDPVGLEACVGRALERLWVPPAETGIVSIAYRLRAAPTAPNATSGRAPARSQ